MSYIDSLKTRISNAIVESVARTIVEETTPSLTLQLKKIMADNFVFYFKAHSAHWNVEGDEFPMYHDFFSKIYEEAQGNVDTIAEQLRALGVYAPVSLREIMLDTTLAEFGEVKDADGMLADLGDDVQKIIASLLAGQKLAEDANETGLANFLQDLIDKNKKTAWMIKSTLKEGIESIGEELNEEVQLDEMALSAEHKAALKTLKSIPKEYDHEDLEALHNHLSKIKSAVGDRAYTAKVKNQEAVRKANKHRGLKASNETMNSGNFTNDDGHKVHIKKDRDTGRYTAHVGNSKGKYIESGSMTQLKYNHKIGKYNKHFKA